MKIVMLCEFYNETLEFQENLLVKYYRKHGHDVTVITSTFESVWDYYHDRHDNQTPPRTYSDHGAKIVKLPYRYNILYRLRAYGSIDTILDEEAPDLIFVHSIMPNLSECANYIRRHPECRMILDSHADFSNSGNNAVSLRVLHGIIRKWFLDGARPYLSRIFAVVPDGALFLNTIYGVPLQEIELLPLGADIDLIRALQQGNERARMRAAIGIGDEEIVIFTGGKLGPAKRTEVLLDAVSMLRDVPLRVVIAGEAGAEDGAYRDRLLAQAGGRPEYRFVGWLGTEEIYRHLAMADLAVFPASQSVLWQKAIATGLPVICGDTGHQSASYLNGEDNLIILPPAEISGERLASHIRALVRNPERMRAMSEGALRVADEHLDWNRLIHRTLRFSPRAGEVRA